MLLLPKPTKIGEFWLLRLGWFATNLLHMVLTGLTE